MDTDRPLPGEPGFPYESDLTLPHAHAFGGMGHMLTPAVRRGGHGPYDKAMTARGVIADYLDDAGRATEAGLVRDPGQHVLVDDGGRVRAARWTLDHLAATEHRLLDHLADIGLDDPDPPRWDWHDGKYRGGELNYRDGPRHGVVLYDATPNTPHRGVYHVADMPGVLYDHYGDYFDEATSHLMDGQDLDNWHAGQDAGERLLDAVHTAPVEEVDDAHPSEQAPPTHLGRLREAVARLGRGKSPGSLLQQMVKATGRYTPDDLDGLRVYVHPESKQVWIDQLDWHDGKAGGEVIEAAKKVVGEDNVTIHNEGPRPPGGGWIDVLDYDTEPTKRSRSPLADAVARLARDDKPADAPKKKYGCVMIPVTGPAADAVLAMGGQIADEDLGEDGRELWPHLTLAHGFESSVTADDVRRVLAGEGPVRYTLGELSAFYGKDTGKDYDVIKVAVESPEMHRLHAKLLKALPNTQKFPDYKPHLTIAYTRAGLADGYIKKLKAKAKGLGEGEAAEAVYSTATKERTTIPLAEGPAKKSRSPLADAVARLARPGAPVRYMADDDLAALHRALEESGGAAETPPLVYADYLDDAGKPHHAEAVRRAVEAWGRRAAGGHRAFYDPDQDGAYRVKRVGADYVPPGGSHVASFRMHNHPGHRWVYLSQRFAHDSGVAGVTFEFPVPEAEHARLIRGLRAEGARLNGDLRDEFPDEPAEPHRYAAYRAPAGGAVVRGTWYKGGALLPDLTKFLPRLRRVTAGRKAPKTGTQNLVVSYGGPGRYTRLREAVARLRAAGSPERKMAKRKSYWVLPPEVATRNPTDPLWNYYRGELHAGGGHIPVTQRGRSWPRADPLPVLQAQLGRFHGRIYDRMPDLSHARPPGFLSRDEFVARDEDATRPGADDRLMSHLDPGRYNIPQGEFSYLQPDNHARHDAVWGNSGQLPEYQHPTTPAPGYRIAAPHYRTEDALGVMMHSAESHHPYRLLAAAVHSGNRHALPPLLAHLRANDNPSGWHPAWAELEKVMAERIGDLPHEDVRRRVQAVADATARMFSGHSSHHAIAEAIRQTGDITPMGALADHMDDNGLPQYAELIRAELANVEPGMRSPHARYRRGGVG